MNDEWKRFLKGHWQREMPMKSGKFPVKAFNPDGKTSGKCFSFAVIFEDPVTFEFRSVHGWGGWWWSEPMPDEMPSLPDSL